MYSSSKLRVAISPQHSLTARYHSSIIRLFHMSTSTEKQATNDNKEEDTSKNNSTDWIPPQRPLAGDLGHSDLYAAKLPSKKIYTSSIIAEDIVKNIEDDENANENVEFIDLDDLDVEQLNEQLIKQGNDSKKNFTITSKGGFGKDDDVIWQEIMHDIDDDESDYSFDVEEAFGNDKVLNDIMNDLENDDEDMLELKMEMVEERLRELEDEFIKEKAIITDSAPSSFDEKNYDDNAELDEFLKNQNFTKHDHTKTQKSASTGPDWLSTRKLKMSLPTDMLTPEESSKAQRLDGEIPVIKDTLLSSHEIMSCLKTLGAIDVSLVIPDKKTIPYLGWNGLIIATGTSFSHIRVLSDAIVNNLRKRNLANKGIIGALYGSEGGEDTTTSWKKRRGKPKKMDDGWIAIDCGNFIVHVQDEMTRNSIDLEGLWSPGERGRAGKELRTIDISNDDAIEDYVANNPVPKEYTESLINTSGDFWGEGYSRGGLGNIAKPKSGRWTPTSNEKRKYKNRGRSK